MRRLADKGVSVRALYNHFGDKDGLVTALIQRSMDSMDVATHHLSSDDPIERIWEAIALDQQSGGSHPQGLVRAVLMDDRLLKQMSVRWIGWNLVVSEIRAAAHPGALRGDIEPEVLIDHAGMVLFHLQRPWTAGDIDTAGLRAGALNAFDRCLLTVARLRARARMLNRA